MNTFLPQSCGCLTEYDWPGNVRELENIIERGMIVSSGSNLDIDPTWLQSKTATRQAADLTSNLAMLERQAILDALKRCHGKIYGPAGAAAALGLKPTTLYGKMRKLQIPRHSAE